MISYEILNYEITSLFSLKKQKNLILLDRILLRFSNQNKYLFSVFLERLSFNAKLKNSLSNYGNTYDKIHSMISDNDTKENLLLNRFVFKKIIGLRKVLAIINKIKYEGPIINRFNQIIKKDDFKLNSTFLRWKKYTILWLNNDFNKGLRICKFINNTQIILNKFFMIFFQKITKKVKEERVKLSETRINLLNLIYYLKRLTFKIKADCFARLFKNKVMNSNRKFLIIKNFILTKEYLEGFYSKVNVKHRIRKWKTIMEQIRYNQQMSVKINKNKKLLRNNNIYVIYRFFIEYKTIFKKKFFFIFKNKILVKSTKNSKFSYDNLINQNQVNI